MLNTFGANAPSSGSRWDDMNVEMRNLRKNTTRSCPWTGFVRGLSVLCLRRENVADSLSAFYCDACSCWRNTREKERKEKERVAKVFAARRL